MRVLFDTSALYKRYAAEAGTDEVQALSESAHEVCVAAHCLTEIASVLNRQRHDGLVPGDGYVRILSEVHRDFQDFTQVALDANVQALSIAAMERIRLRAMDALHIGSAQHAAVDLFVTADRRQAAAAEAAGLKTQLIRV
jgi:predicted nucleic acid-binding protein